MCPCEANAPILILNQTVFFVGLVSLVSKVDIAHPVETLTLQYRLRLVANICQIDWGNIVLLRIDSAIDLPAAAV